MKKMLLLALCAFQFSNAQIVEIPDPIFKNALLTYEPAIDLNGDGEIQVSEAEEVIYLTVRFIDVVDPTGIEAFKNVTHLNMEDNQITNIDVSALEDLIVLNLSTNPITSIDVSNNTQLKRLSMYWTNLTEIDVSNNLDLEFLDVGANSISSLDISQLSQLNTFYCYGNLFTTLDFSNNPLLQELVLIDNDRLEFLNLQNGTNASTLAALHIMGVLTKLECVQVDADIIGNIPEAWEYNEDLNFSADCSLGLNDLSELELKIYPNPVQDVLNISSQKKIEAVQIYDANGKLISHSTQNKISLNHLPNGIYWISVQIDGKTHRQKFIKKN